MRYFIIIPIFLFFSTIGTAQKNDYSSLLIPDNLKENANSSIMNQILDVSIHRKLVTIKTEKVITVFNANGVSNIDAREFYNKSIKVKLIEATIYNSFGKEIKKIKRSDFKDQSVADGFSVLTDGRTIFLDYTPTEYPFTIVYESEVESSNTAFIPSWNPIDDYFESIKKSTINIIYEPDLGFKNKEINFEDRNIVVAKNANSISYSIENVPAEKVEAYSPSIKKIFPYVLFGLEKFNLEGIEGNAKTWEDFGKWVYDNLLKDTDELPLETQNKIKQLVGNETDPLKKAKLVYQYVQDKTRYISVQLGIGGWKPMLAKDVDRLGYGDCKALSNYTRSLLKVVGVDAYYTIIYGGNSKSDLQQDFVSMQGNHAILSLPNKDKMIFLECTSQTVPFGYGGDFTDDRYALIVKPDKGEIVKTNEYTEATSSQLTKGNYIIDENGTLNGSIQIKSKGIQYDDAFYLEKKSKLDIDKYYKSHFETINNLKIEKTKFINDRENIEFTQELQLNALAYANNSGNIMMFPLNAFNQRSIIPQRYRNRKNPFEISRGFYDEDEIEIIIPENYKIDARPENFDVKDKFGTYKIEIKILEPKKILYKRILVINKGFYDKIDYDNYRKFTEQIARADNSKIVISKQ